MKYFMIYIVGLCCLMRSSQGIHCCSQSRLPSCINACYKSQRSRRLVHKFRNVRKFCPSTQNEFWRCVNMKWNMSKESYPHSVCCSLAKTSLCAVECFIAKNTDVIMESCDSIKEVKLRRCVNKVEIQKRCCKQAKTSLCKMHCTKVFMPNQAVNSGTISTLNRVCRRLPAVATCLHGKQDNVKDLGYSQCCQHGRDKNCQKRCKEVFSKVKDEKDQVNELSKVCGPPALPQNKFYNCILRVNSNIEKLEGKSHSPGTTKDAHVLKGQCCPVATSSACQTWCNRVFSKKSFIGLDDPMYVQCMENPQEYGLSTCIGDVLEPCKFGCKDEMKFCSNFNNRPLELFRRCDPRADKAAKELYDSWKNGHFSYSSIPVAMKDMVSCEPESWKALACMLAIKPCSRKSNRNQLCRSDCASLLNKCLVQTNKEEAKTAEEICIKLMPNPDQSDCVTSSKYTSPAIEDTNNLATFPCQHDPCKHNEVCTINEECSFGRRSASCRPYQCVRGCSVGSSANIKVRRLDFVKIPQERKNKICFRVCQCLASDNLSLHYDDLSSCVEFGCSQNRPCKFANQVREHKSNFNVGLDFCTCFDSEVICTKKAHSNWTMSNPGGCQCNDVFNPVCGMNGLTYPSVCRARCSGLNDDQLIPGACPNLHHCNPNPCPSHLVCMPHKRVCVLADFICPQYDCVEPQQTLDMIQPCLLDLEQTKECEREPLSKHCCKGNCHEKFNRSPVCGLDGVTYNSYCDAANHMIPVDYEGQCNQGQELPLKKRCRHVTCPMKKNNCKSHIPSGGCCPICEPIMRLLFSQMDAENHIRRISPKPMTVWDIVEQLSHQVFVSECYVRGFLSLENDIIIIIRTSIAQKTLFQREICEREAERLSNMINSGSPLITTNYALSIAKASFIEYPSDSQSSGAEIIFVSKRTVFAILLFTIVQFGK